ncbi:MAG: adenine-specific methyltransferase EcoRI family protein, partial [Bacteroidales bacterium]|nr:adenine-specific methyltransferase EcoRI family protein [Bacteroidales bacterium]
MANKNLNKAKEAKKDEFYTQLDDINNELKHYREHFRGKTVLCNCDDPRVSNFFTYFAYNFEFLGLKKLITTCYKNQDMDLFSQNQSDKAVYLVYEGDKNGDHIPNADEIGVMPLKGDGDFRSKECIELLKEADIVVTNPPFSLFREYVAQLIEYDKKFLIIGNVNAVKYKELFPLIMNNKIWLGASIHSGDRKFWVPNDYELNAAGCGIDETGRKYIRVKGVRWFTNLDYKERHENLILYKHYSPEEYPKFENFDAININRTEDIPCDYNGVMGVPITFMDKYNPEQFEILGVGIAGLGLAAGVKPYKPEHKKYRKEVQKRGAVDGDLYMMNGDEVIVPYSRILIR